MFLVKFIIFFSKFTLLISLHILKNYSKYFNSFLQQLKLYYINKNYKKNQVKFFFWLYNVYIYFKYT